MYTCLPFCVFASNWGNFGAQCFKTIGEIMPETIGKDNVSVASELAPNTGGGQA